MSPQSGALRISRSSQSRQSKALLLVFQRLVVRTCLGCRVPLHVAYDGLGWGCLFGAV